MFKVIKKTGAGAFSNAMGRATIKKSRVSFRKTTGVGGNLFVMLVIVAFIFNSCATSHLQKMKVDFVGFSDGVTPSYQYTNKCIVKKWRKQSPPFDLIYTDGTKRIDGEREMSNVVYNVRQGDQTSAYYALDAALDRVEYVQRKFMDNDPDSKYYVIMLSDGVDTKVPDKKAYGEKIQKRAGTLLKKYCFFNLFRSKKPNTTNTFETYALMYKGKDLKETNLSDEQLKMLLFPYIGTQNIDEQLEEKKERVIIKEDINELISILEEKLIARSFRFRVPVGFNGEGIKMVLTPKDQAHPVYFEGEFSKEGEAYYFKKITTSDGFSIELPASKYLIGYSVGNGLVEFEAENLRLDGKPYKVNRDNVNQWHNMLGTYAYNSEYSSRAASHKNSYLIVLLDGSKSFREKFRDAQDAIMRIVKIVSEL